MLYNVEGNQTMIPIIFIASIGLLLLTYLLFSQLVSQNLAICYGFKKPPKDFNHDEYLKSLTWEQIS